MSKNPKKRCRICGGKVKANIRFCKLCFLDIKREKGTFQENYIKKER